MSKQRSGPAKNSSEWYLTQHITTFANVAFERKLRPSRALYDAIVAAKDSGYSEDDIRIAFWVARAIRTSDELGGVAWLKSALMNHQSLDLVLRHRGGVNPVTGVPAKRWLDELLSRVDETNPDVISAILKQLPPSVRDIEVLLLDRMEVKYTK